MKLSLRPGIAIVLGLVWGVQRVYGQSGYTTNPAASAPEVIDGQIFGPGLIIVDSPQPNTPSNGDLPIAIDISGDGTLPFPSASLPGSTNPTALHSVNIFVSSLAYGQNLTISPTDLLEQESGSTVKHLNFQVGNYSCLQEGTYNLSFHESFRLNGTEGFYTVLDIPIVLQDLGDRDNSTLCMQNPINNDIQQIIPVPRPLTKVNGEIVANFQGTEAQQQGGGSSIPYTAQTLATVSVSPLPSSTWVTTIYLSPVESVETIASTISVTAQTTEIGGTVQEASLVTVSVLKTETVGEVPATTTTLDGGSFGGPGGDLSNIGNNSTEINSGSSHGWKESFGSSAVAFIGIPITLGMYLIMSV